MRLKFGPRDAQKPSRSGSPGKLGQTKHAEYTCIYLHCSKETVEGGMQYGGQQLSSGTCLVRIFGLAQPPACIGHCAAPVLALDWCSDADNDGKLAALGRSVMVCG